MTHRESLGERLAQLRREKSANERRDVKQAEVAKAVGLTAKQQSYVARWENDVIPRDDILIKLAAFYRVSLGWLRYGEGSRTPGTEGLAATDSGAPEFPPVRPQRPYIPQKKKGGRR